MAGGKETPRQKMIGIMYLVLLALLALQIGAEIMVKFQQLNNSMESLVDESQKKSTDTLKGIKDKATQDGRQDILNALKKAESLHQISSTVIEEIKSIKLELIEKTGGMEDGVPKGMKDSDKTSLILVGQNDNKQGRGYKLEKQLNTYVEELNKIDVDISKLLKSAPSNYPKMALSGKEDPMFAKNEEQRGKDWPTLAFDHTPMIAALAYLTEKQARVANYEAEILQKIKASLGEIDMKFDQITPMAAAESNVVAAGTEYQADLFITASSSSKDFNPVMTFNGSSIKVESGFGKVKFKASTDGGAKVPGNDNIVEKSWKGVIKMNSPSGELKEYAKVFKYFVAKPVIQIQSASVSALYKNCGNELNVQVPALGSLYDPSFSASGAQVIKGAQKGLVTLVPNAPSVKLNVSSGGSPIGSEEFKVRLVPKPTIEVWNSANKKADDKTGETPSKLRSISCQAIPDESFKAFLPRDAKYRVTRWTITLVRGKRPVGAPMNVSGPSANLSSMMGQAVEGDRLMCEILEVQRATYTGSTETVNLGTPIINIPIK